MLKRILLATALILALTASCALADGETAHTCTWKEVTRVDSTCYAQGLIYYECADASCKKTQTTPIAPKAHKWKEYYTVDSSCVEHGYTIYLCDVCAKEKTETLPLGNHYYGKWTVTQEPTCTERGIKNAYCRYCNRKGTSYIAKTPHPFGEWSITVQPTDCTSGVREHTCTYCGLTEKAEFYPDGTLYQGMPKNDSVRALQQYLIDNGYLVSRVDGDYGKKTTQGVINYQQAMGYTPSGIAYPQTLKNILCVSYAADGTFEAVHAMHAYDGWTVTKEATDNATGLRTHTCTRCAFTEETSYYPEGTLYEGMPDNEDIRKMQKALVDQKVAKTAVDGNFGKQTRKVVEKFQELHGLEVTGIAYPETLKVLYGE